MKYTQSIFNSQATDSLYNESRKKPRGKIVAIGVFDGMQCKSSVWVMMLLTSGDCYSK